MSEVKTDGHTYIVEGPASADPSDSLAMIVVSSDELVRGSNYIDLRDAAGNTLLTLTWPSKYKVREI